jgi:CO/xanthine dehydrogenase FAD-binding subunit
VLTGSPSGDEAFYEAAEAMSELVDIADDFFASQDLRRHVVQSMTVRALHTAAARAGERSGDR